MTRSPLFAGLLVGSFAAALLAAPGPKEKEVPLGPIKPEQRRQSAKNLREFGLAFHNFHDTNGFMPTNLMSKDKPLLSWRVQILPYIEQDSLYKQFKLNEPWDSDHNAKLIEKMPAIYAPPRGRAKTGETFYQVVGGKNGMIKAGQRVGLANVTDGLSNTIMVTEAGKPVIWTKPDDLTFDGKELPTLGGMFDGQFAAVFGDGVVYRIKKGADAEALKRLLDPNDGQVVDKDAVIEDEEKE